MYLILYIALLLSSCQNTQSNRIVVQLDSEQFKFNLDNIDSLIKSELRPIDTGTFNQYIAKNSVILGENYDDPRLYADGFWIKKYSDSLNNNIIFNKLLDSKYFFLPNSIIEKKLNGFLILISYPKGYFGQYEEHFALYLIRFPKKSNYPNTILLAEKSKHNDLNSRIENTTSVLRDSVIVRTHISKSCITDLPGPKGEIVCIHDTTITFLKLNVDNRFSPYKRTSNWQIK